MFATSFKPNDDVSGTFIQFIGDKHKIRNDHLFSKTVLNPVRQMIKIKSVSMKLNFKPK